MIISVNRYGVRKSKVAAKGKNFQGAAPMLEFDASFFLIILLVDLQLFI